MADAEISDLTPVQLGSVSCPSGILLILDGGCAWMWSHTKSPVMPEYPFLPAAREDARDLVARGRDAMLAIADMGETSAPYLFDQPGDQLEAIHAQFAERVQARGLDARLEPLPARVPHRERVDLVLAANQGRGVVEFCRMTAVVLGGVPTDRLLPIWAEPMGEGPLRQTWRRAWIELGQGEVVTTRAIGSVWVDEARMMAVDADALGAWQDSESLDGKADVVFWGGDAAALAVDLGATGNLRGESVFGWLDVPMEAAAAREKQLMRLISDHKRFAVDLRPHTHHWAVMADVRAAPTQSGTLDLAGARLCMFMTSWGDGSFPVELDCDRSGTPLRLRIELGFDESELESASMIADSK